jgi:hypothetical protein
MTDGQWGIEDQYSTGSSRAAAGKDKARQCKAMQRQDQPNPNPNQGRRQEMDGAVQ